MNVTRILLAASLAAPLGAQSVDDSRLRVETWVSGLTRPVSFAFVGPGEMLIFQNADGRVLRVKDGVGLNQALDVTVTVRGARGIAAHPDFASSPYVCVYYAAAASVDGGPWTDSRLERYTFDGTNLVAPVGPLFTVPFDPTQSNPDAYNGGLIRFGPDGMIYGQVGDKTRGRFGNPRIEQNTGTLASSLAGAIFRLRPDGTVPSDNPFVGAAETGLHPWYAYGFRNSLGMDFDPRSGTLWFTDNSSLDYDEIDRAGPGMNSGWLKIMGPDARNATYPENGGQSYDAVDLVYPAGAFYRDPELSFKDAIGITALCFLSSKRFPEDLRDVLLLGETNFGQLYRLDLDGAREHFLLSGALADLVADTAAERDSLRFGSGFGTVTDMQVGPDGYVYAVDWDGGRIHRIRPLVDLFEPVEMSVVAGALEEGVVADLELSDNETVRLGPASGPRTVERRSLEAVMRLNAAAPLRIDLIVEARASRPMGLQLIEAFHVPSATWHVLDRRRAATHDRVVTVLDLPNPEEYVEPSTATVRVRVTHRSPNHVLWLGRSSGAALRSDVDQIRLAVTWP